MRLQNMMTCGLNADVTKDALHELKTLDRWFERVWDGEKTFEIRRADRDFKSGDTLWLREIIAEKTYTGRELTVQVLDILRGVPGVKPGYVVMPIKVLDRRVLKVDKSIGIEHYFKYHPVATDKRRQAHESINGAALDLAKVIDASVQDEECKKMAMFAIQQARMFANQGATIDELREQAES